MQAIKNKISSQRGASLTFALLIFLVCAVVGSVVLAAGTVAAGRMSQIAEADQRYYSVNSAARLLISLIDEKPVTIIETKMNTDETSQYKDEAGNFLPPDSFDSIPKQAAYICITGSIEDHKLNLKAGEDDTLKPLNVVITETISGIDAETKRYGPMVLKLANDSKDAYAVQLTFRPDVKTEDDKQADRTVTTWKISWSLESAEIIGGSRRVN